MRIDNSALKAFQFCPAYYQERYDNKIELKGEASSALVFGKAFHAMLEARLKDEPLREDVWDGVPEEIQVECEYTYEKYCQVYPVETWETVAVEKLVEVPIEECEACHGTGSAEFFEPDKPCAECEGTGVSVTYVAKIDWIARGPEGLRIVDHKTEERGSVNNTHQRWQYLTQVSLYQWAVAQVYPEPIDKITIDIITRRSLKGRCDPEFSRIDTLRTPWQQNQALETLRYAARQIKEMKAAKWEDNLWPQNRENCQKWRVPCPYAMIHGESGRDEGTLQAKYRPAEEYLAPRA